MSDAVPPVTAIVLCGGGGRRFAGRDKPLELLAGQPLVGHVLARLAGQVSSIVISANRNLTDYEQFGYPVVEDQLLDCGPLAGLHAGLAATDSQWLLVCPGDAPLLPTDLVARLRWGMVSGVDLAIPNDGNRAQHLFMLVERGVAEGVQSYLEQGGRSVAGWLADRKVAEVSVLDPHVFTNVNTPEELALAEQLL